MITAFQLHCLTLTEDRRVRIMARIFNKRSPLRLRVLQAAMNGDFRVTVNKISSEKAALLYSLGYSIKRNRKEKTTIISWEL